MPRAEQGGPQTRSELSRAVARDDSTGNHDKRGVVEVLFAARRLILRRGYDRVSSSRGVSLFDAIWSQDASLARWEARMLLHRLGRSDLYTWDALPTSCERAALELLDLALRKCGVEAPAILRGGHFVAPYAPRPGVRLYRKPRRLTFTPGRGAADPVQGLGVPSRSLEFARALGGPVFSAGSEDPGHGNRSR